MLVGGDGESGLLVITYLPSSSENLLYEKLFCSVAADIRLLHGVYVLFRHWRTRFQRRNENFRQKLFSVIS